MGLWAVHWNTPFLEEAIPTQDLTITVEMCLTGPVMREQSPHGSTRRDCQ